MHYLYYFAGFVLCLFFSIGWYLSSRDNDDNENLFY